MATRQAGAWDFDGVLITDAMSRAGADRLTELRKVDVGLFYVVQEVFLAMLGAEAASPLPPQGGRPQPSVEGLCDNALGQKDSAKVRP